MQWDRAAGRAARMAFDDWITFMDLVVWTHCPPIDDVLKAKRHGVITVLAPLWHEFRPEHRELYPIFDRIIVPSQEIGRFAIRCGGGNRVFAPTWDPGLPLLRKLSRSTAAPALLLPLFDADPRRIEDAILDVLGRILEEFLTVTLTVAYNTSTVAPFVKRRIKRYSKCFNGRVKAITGVHPDYRPLLYCTHDLMVWPVDRVDVGLSALTALSVSTPVIHFDIPPTRELLPRHTAVAVPCPQESTETGVPVGRPVGYDVFHGHLRDCVGSPERLAELHRAGLHGLEHRRRLFNEVIKTALTP